MKRVALAVALVLAFASPAVAQDVVAPNAGDTDIDADTQIGDANVGTTVDSGNTNTDASVDNSVDDSGNVTTDASVGSNNTTASYNNTEANPTTITEANPVITTVTEANPVTTTGDIGSGNTVNAPVNAPVDVSVNCSVVATCEDNDTISDNDSCNVNSCNQDNSKVRVEDNSTNIDDSFNGNRDSFNGSALAFALDSVAVVDSGSKSKATSSRRRTVSEGSEGSVRLYSKGGGKELPYTGGTDLRLLQALLALFAVLSIAIGSELIKMGKGNRPHLAYN